MRVLLIYHGGLTPYTRRLYRTLAGRPEIDELTVLVPERVQTERVYAPNGWLSATSSEAEDGYKVVAVPLQNPANYGHGFDRTILRAAIRSANADVIQVLDEPFSGYLLQVIQLSLLASRRSRILFYGFENRPLHLGRRAGTIWKFAWPRTAGGAAANSEALGNLQDAGYPRGRPLERIFWGVPTEIFENSEPADLQALGINAEQVVGYVGRFIEAKGLLVLAAAMLRLPKQMHCLLVGSGPLLPQLELLAALPQMRGRVHLHDVMDSEELARTMKALDVLVLPSLTAERWKEQYGRVLPEAMAAGVPVIGSDSGAIPEVIGSAGLVTPEGDPSALADAVDRLTTDRQLRDQMVTSGKARASQELSVDSMVAKLCELYRRVL